MLFTRLQRQAIGRLAVRIDADTDEAAGHRPLESAANGHEAGMRAAEPHRDTESLGGADGNICTERARRFEQGQCKEISRNSGECFVFMRCGNRSTQIADRARGTGVRQQDAEVVADRNTGCEVVLHEVDAQRHRSCAHDGKCLRMRV